MKTLRILFVLTLISFAGYAQIPNASFENWHAYPPTGTPTGEYPDGWMTSDSVSNANGGGNNVYKGSDGVGGSFCIHMKSVAIAGGIIKGPGLATNGIITNSGFNFLFSGGTADTTRHGLLVGKFKYIPTDPDDEGRITIILKGDSAGTRDTVAIGTLAFTGSTTTWTDFVLPIIGLRAHNPDTFLIVMQSSRAINDPDLGINTELVIDSLGFASTIGIDEMNDIISSVNVYPSPAQNQLTLTVDTKKKVAMSGSIYDLTGKKVLDVPSVTERQTIDVSSLSKGNYILKINDEKGTPLSSKTFMKE